MTFSASPNNKAEGASEVSLPTKRATDRLATAFADLREAMAGVNATRAASNVMWSREHLGLTTTTTTISPVVGTLSTLRSAEQLNNSARVDLFTDSPLWGGSSTAMPAVSGTFTGTKDDILTFSASKSVAGSLASGASINATSRSASTVVRSWSGASSATPSVSGTYTGSSDKRYRLTVGAQTAATYRSSAEVNTTTRSASTLVRSWSGTSTATPAVTGAYTGTTDDRWTFSVGASTTSSLVSGAAVNASGLHLTSRDGVRVLSDHR